LVPVNAVRNCRFELTKPFIMNFPCGNTQKLYSLSFKCLLLVFFTFRFTNFSTAQTVSSASRGSSGPGNVNDGLVLWLDAADVNADGSIPSDNASISTWKDRSAYGNDATVYTEQNPATFLSNQINGNPVLHFTRQGDAQGSVFITNVDIRPVTNPDVTIFTVYRQGLLSGGNQAPWGSDNADWDRFYISSFSGGTDGVAPFGPAPPYNTPVIGGAVVGKTRLLTAVYDGDISGEDNVGPENGSAIYFNGQLITAFTDKTHLYDEQSNFYVGWDGDNSAYNGDIAEVIIYTRKLTECEILQINTYLADKYGENFSTTKVTTSAENNVICPDGSVTLTASSGQSYKWFKDAVEIADSTGITFEAKEGGSYQVVVTNESGCTETSAPIVLTKSTLSTAITAGGPLEFCSGTTVDLTAQPGYEYEWYADGEPVYEYSQTISASGSGKYTVRTTDAATGCSATTAAEDAIQVVVNESPNPSISPEGPTAFCAGGIVVLNAAPGLAKYEWYRNDQLIPGVTGAAYTATQEGSYSMHVKTDKGCVNNVPANSELSAEVTVRSLPEAKIELEGNASICQDGQVTLKAPADLESYSWYKNNVSIDEHDQQLITNKAGSYTVNVTNKYCGNSTSTEDAVVVSIKPNLQAAISLKNDEVSCEGQVTTLQATSANGGAAPKFEWFINKNTIPDNNKVTLASKTLKPGDVVQIKLTSNADGCMSDSTALSSLYTLKLKSTDDCDNDGITNVAECPSGVNCGDKDKDKDGVPDYLDTDSDGDGRPDNQEGTGDCNSNGVPDYLDTEPCNTSIIMPTLFSPNGDGKNDVIRPIIPGLKTFSYIKIFNRWGNVVFESKDPNRGWDGNLGGKAQAQDTYIWISSGIDNSGKPVTFRGLFTLIR